MDVKTVSNSYVAQRGRPLQYPQEKGSISTLQARQLLAVMHPAGLVKDLRNAVYVILTYRSFDIDSAGLYVLKSGGKDD